MHYPNFYAELSEEKIEEAIRREGFEPLRISDPPGHAYPSHRHPETKLLAFLRGTMTVRVGEASFRCTPGDKVVIPGNVEHSAVVGPEGCVFFWSEKL